MKKTTVGFVSLGCSKNLVDSEIMLAKLDGAGFEIVNDPAGAEVIVVNTCAFIDSAKEEAINTILEMAEYKHEGKCRVLVAAGCLVQRYAADFKEELPEVDAIIGASGIDKIVEVVESALDGKRAEAVFDRDRAVQDTSRVITTPPYMAYLKIAEGCDNHCTYCAIPSIRGKLRSRTVESLVDEAKSLAKSGVKELLVIAQDSTRYGMDIYGEPRLCELLEELCKIEGIEWIRVHYCYPENITDEFIALMKREKKIVRYLDIPVQHASDRILKLMGRRTSRAEIEELVKKLRREMPDISLRTSIIVGFPTESDDDFAELCDFAKSVKFDRMGVFEYSREEGTAASKLDGQIGDEVKVERRETLMLTAQSVTEERNRALCGKTVRVLVEGFDENMYFGRSQGESADVDPKIYFAAQRDVQAGEFVNVKILDFDEYDLYGEEEV